MFIGHFGLGFSAKKINRAPSLGTLFMASQFIDLLWPIFLILGIEKVTIDPGNTAFTPLDFIYYPFSHSFAGVLFWAVLFGSIYFIIKKNIKNSLILSLLVISHWFLDLLTHRPDLPLMPGYDKKIGFGLWNSIAATLVIESLIYFIGVYIYLKATKAINKKGSLGFYGLVIFLFVVYLMNIFGPPPASPEPIGYIGLSMWLLVWWAYWVDRNRKSF